MGVDYFFSFFFLPPINDSWTQKNIKIFSLLHLFSTFFFFFKMQLGNLSSSNSISLLSVKSFGIENSLSLRLSAIQGSRVLSTLLFSPQWMERRYWFVSFQWTFIRKWTQETNLEFELYFSYQYQWHYLHTSRY